MSACPACGASQPDGHDICDSCGLVFASAAPAPPPRPLRPGQLLDGGRFLLQRPLATGGTATIFLATDRRAFGRAVAIKALPAHPLPDHGRAAAGALLDHEAQLLARLSHPHIPRLLGYGCEDGGRYLALEYFAGGDLLARLSHNDEETGRPVAGAPYDRAEVLGLGDAICATLEYLHAQRPTPVLHGDIKPANIVRDPASGAVYLIDFGAASGGQSSMGTPGYAPPEQYRGKSEPRSDVYALAATLYHLATDDDPGLHPLRFPLLGTLGPLADVLRPALDADAARRPTATALRRLLAALDAPANALLTPDGAIVADEAALAAWCERNWRAATAWLYGGLPAEAARWRGPALADALRSIAGSHASADGALDAALALLDPHGYGAAPLALVSSARVLDMGRLRPGDTRTLVVANNGRRYVAPTLLAPGWLVPEACALALAPGQQTSVTLRADATQATGGRLRAWLRLEHNGAALASVVVQGRARRRRPTRAQLGAALAVGLLALLVALCALAAWSLL